MKVSGNIGSLTLDDLRYGRTSKVTPNGYRRLMGRQPGECTWCGGPVPKGARSWCGPVCVDEWKIRNQPAVARTKVLLRDGGVCASCGANCLERTLRMEAAWSACVAALPSKWGLLSPEALAAFRSEVMAATGIVLPAHSQSAWTAPRIPPTWEADHVVPVCEGGGFCGLDNYRTLCVFCHRRETAALAARRAQARRGQPADTAQVALFGANPTPTSSASAGEAV